MNYSEVEAKVREATNDDTWGPHGSLMSEISKYTFTYEHYPEVMSMLWKRMFETKKNWRRTYKVRRRGLVKCECLYAEKMFIAFCFLSCYLSTFTITQVYANISFFPSSPTLLPFSLLPPPFPLPCHFYHSPSCYSTTLSAMVLSVWWQVLESTSTTWKLSRSMSSEMNTARTRASMVSSGRREEELGRRIGGGVM